MRFAGDVDLLGDGEKELQQLSERLEKPAAGYGMEISSVKSKILDADSDCQNWLVTIDTEAHISRPGVEQKLALSPESTMKKEHRM